MVEFQSHFHLAFAFIGSSVALNISMRKSWNRCNLFRSLQVPKSNIININNDLQLAAQILLASDENYSYIHRFCRYELAMRKAVPKCALLRSNKSNSPFLNNQHVSGTQVFQATIFVWPTKPQLCSINSRRTQ